MRRILWNIYAWPVTLLLVAAFVMSIHHNGFLGLADALVSIPALVALHLHIWDKRCCFARIWRLYAFAFIVWELTYNIVLQPIQSGKRFDAVLLVMPIVFLPLYIALFRYAFRKWTGNQFPNTRRHATV